jgi:hypothetical protein
MFSNFDAYIGPGTSVSDRMANCEIHLGLSYPSGIQYSVVSATYYGYAQLDSGVTGKLYTNFFYSSDASKTVSINASRRCVPTMYPYD